MTPARWADHRRKPLINRLVDVTTEIFPQRGSGQTSPPVDSSVTRTAAAFVAVAIVVLVLIRELDPEQAARTAAALSALIGGFGASRSRRRR
ncbi:hypothetical protein ACWEPB_26610 [Kitasatospora cineracea]